MGRRTWTCLARTRAQRKFPASVFELNNRQIGLMISRMWDGDGHVDVDAVAVCTMPPLHNAWHSNFNICFCALASSAACALWNSPTKMGRVGYQVFITGYENINTFKEHIGCFLSAKNVNKQLVVD
jgi:hypothetical protein